MTKVENKQLTFEEMEAQLFYAYQKSKLNFVYSLDFMNGVHGRAILFTLKGKNGFCVVKNIYNFLDNEEKKKLFDVIIELLNVEERKEVKDKEWNAKVVCISSNVFCDIGRIYTIENGYMVDCGRFISYRKFKNIDDLNNYSKPQFVELVE